MFKHPVFSYLLISPSILELVTTEREESSAILINGGYASVNSSSAHPPPGNPGAFPNVARPGGGAFAYLGLTPGHLTRGFETVE